MLLLCTIRRVVACESDYKAIKLLIRGPQRDTDSTDLRGSTPYYLPEIVRRLEGILPRGVLCVLRLLAVNAGRHFHRQGAKDAKRTLRSPVCGSATPCESVRSVAYSADWARELFTTGAGDGKKSRHRSGA